MLKLRRHQQDMLRYAFKVQHPALFADPRTGKTIVTVRRCKAYNGVRLILVAAPYSTMEAWQETLTAENEQLLIATGDHDNPAEVLATVAAWPAESGRVWCFANKELHLRFGAAVASVPWDVVILDESTFIKSPKAQVSHFYTKHFRKAAHRWVLTGTPAPESELEYYQQLKFLDPAILGFKDFYAYRRAWFINNAADPAGRHEYYIKREGRARLTAKLAKAVLFVTQQDAGITSRKIIVRRPVRLPPSVRKAYDEAERTFILKYPTEEIDRTIFSIEAWTWMRRMCGGWLPQVGAVPCEKLDDLVAYMQGELATCRVVVWSIFLDEIRIICDRLLSEGIKTDYISGARSHAKRIELRQAFAAGKLRVLVCQPECFRHGINLSDADALIYYSVPAGLETYQQSVQRATHMTKPRDVLVVHYATVNTVEEDLLNSLSRKEHKHEQTRSIVRAIAARQGLSR